MDQAEMLRVKFSETILSTERRPRVLAITSGKGGVGKTNVVANLAIALSNAGQKTLILDADLGLGNLDILFGIIPQYTLEHVLLGDKGLSDVIMKGPGGIHVLPSSSGVEELTALDHEKKLILLSELEQLEKEVDVLLIDTASGISSNVCYFNMAAQEIIVVASGEPASITDAYAVMKVMSKQYGEKRFHLLVNLVQGYAEAKEVYRKLSLVAGQFLGVAVEYLGYIPEDDYLRMAVHQQRAVVDLYPQARSSRQFEKLAGKVLRMPIPIMPKGNVQFLWNRLVYGSSHVIQEKV